jgi:hypothetical protein
MDGHLAGMVHTSIQASQQQQQQQHQQQVNMLEEHALLQQLEGALDAQSAVPASRLHSVEQLDRDALWHGSDARSLLAWCACLDYASYVDHWNATAVTKGSDVTVQRLEQQSVLAAL